MGHPSLSVSYRPSESRERPIALRGTVGLFFKSDQGVEILPFFGAVHS